MGGTAHRRFGCLRVGSIRRDDLHRIQGPKSREIMQKIAEFDASNDGLPYYRFVNGRIAGIDCLVARLGVTGELGYEIFYDPGYAWQMYDAFVKAGESDGLELC